MQPLRPKSIRPRARGFTRSDLLALLAILGLISLIAIPALAQSKARSQQMVCLNNLRLIGRAFLVWNAEHDQADPWRTPYWEGGTQIPASTLPPIPIPDWAAQRNGAWFQYYWIRQYLGTPTILVCPSDMNRVITTDFSSSGFASYRDKALSYFVSLDSSFAAPASVLSGDRNFRINEYSPSCSSGIGGNGVYGVNSTYYFAGWTNAVHGLIGNVLFHDGRVEPRTTTEFNATFFPSLDDRSSAHFLIP